MAPPIQPNCRQIVDKYVEYEFVLKALDMILLRSQVYRHLLFNFLPRKYKPLETLVRNYG